MRRVAALAACAALGAVTLVPLAASARAAACPDCEVGRRARSDVMADHFALHLSASVAPFAVIGLVCALVERGGGRRREQHEDARRPRGV